MKLNPNLLGIFQTLHLPQTAHTHHPAHRLEHLQHTRHVGAIGHQPLVVDHDHDLRAEKNIPKTHGFRVFQLGRNHVRKKKKNMTGKPREGCIGKPLVLHGLCSFLEHLFQCPFGGSAWKPEDLATPRAPSWFFVHGCLWPALLSERIIRNQWKTPVILATLCSWCICSQNLQEKEILLFTCEVTTRKKINFCDKSTFASDHGLKKASSPWHWSLEPKKTSRTTSPTSSKGLRKWVDPYSVYSLPRN